VHTSSSRKEGSSPAVGRSDTSTRLLLVGAGGGGAALHRNPFVSILVLFTPAGASAAEEAAETHAEGAPLVVVTHHAGLMHARLAVPASWVAPLRWWAGQHGAVPHTAVAAAEEEEVVALTEQVRERGRERACWTLSGGGGGKGPGFEFELGRRRRWCAFALRVLAGGCWVVGARQIRQRLGSSGELHAPSAPQPHAEGAEWQKVGELLRALGFLVAEVRFTLTRTGCLSGSWSVG
jgi:hypothetical protein